MSNDIAACEAMQFRWGARPALTASGTFMVIDAVLFSEFVVDIDVDLQFPSGGALPESVAFRATGCNFSCAEADCRP